MRIEDDINKVSSYKVKIVEEGGKTIGDILIKKNPLTSSKCERYDCQVCPFEKSKGGCNRRSILYSNTCVKCEEGGGSKASTLGKVVPAYMREQVSIFMMQ